ncbi:PspC domain-containing protein [Flindersiella endophytica]
MVTTRSACDDRCRDPKTQESTIFVDNTGTRQASAYRRCARRTDGKVIGGVAGGLADHFGVPAMYVRLAFVVLMMFDGFSIFVYAALWIFLPQDTMLANVNQPAGVAAATRRGLRKERGRFRREDAGPVIAIVALAIGLIFLLQQLGNFDPRVFWPILVGGVGLAVLWRQVDEAQRVRWTSGAPKGIRRVFTGGLSGIMRALTGIALIIGAATWALVASEQSGIAQALAAVLIGLFGIGLIIGPWVWRLTTDLSEERQERIRSQERADMAAHLHDSVLQTLALIQKQAHDQRTVQRLARAQERDLRQWLYGEQEDSSATLRSALRKGAAEIEDYHGVPVEVVAVGDAPLAPPVLALVQAAREAMVNAAKHSGAPRIDVYAEAESDRVEVFVRDRGVGFDLDSVSEDRLGVKRSILGRMERHGGKADIKSAPGEGTEVRLVVDLNGKENNS